MTTTPTEFNFDIDRDQETGPYAIFSWDLKVVEVFEVVDSAIWPENTFGYGFGMVGCIYDDLSLPYDSFNEALRDAMDFMNERDNLIPKFPDQWKEIYKEVTTSDVKEIST